MPRYSTILFDADNTLLDFKRSEHEAILDTIKAMGFSPSEEMAAVYSRINDANWKKLERGEITKSELRTARFQEFCDYYGFTADTERFADTYVAALSRKSYLMKGALDVCRALAPYCRLYIVTNGMKVVQEGRFNPSPLYPLFSDVFVSEEIGAEKPNPKFFEVVATRIPQFKKEETLVVGDSLSSDMAGGVRAGIDTCWFNPCGVKAPVEMKITYTIERLEDLLPLILGE